MYISELRDIKPPKGKTYCLTQWAGTIHLTLDLHHTICGYEVDVFITPDDALECAKSMCHGCFQK